jgi:hypothetical protein
MGTGMWLALAGCLMVIVLASCQTQYKPLSPDQNLMKSSALISKFELRDTGGTIESLITRLEQNFDSQSAAPELKNCRAERGVGNAWLVLTFETGNNLRAIWEIGVQIARAPGEPGSTVEARARIVEIENATGVTPEFNEILPQIDNALRQASSS